MCIAPLRRDNVRNKTLGNRIGVLTIFWQEIIYKSTEFAMVFSTAIVNEFMSIGQIQLADSYLVDDFTFLISAFLASFFAAPDVSELIHAVIRPKKHACS